MQVSDLKWYRSGVVSNTASNGGVMSNNLIANAVRNNLFPDIAQSERLSGVTRYRKAFAKVANSSNKVLFNSKIHLTSITPANDYITFFAGTFSDTQNNISSPTEYGAAVLASGITAGASSCTVTLENTDMLIFRNGDTIWIGDETNEEYHSNVTVVKNDLNVTITLEAGDSFSNSYASDVVVSSCILSGDIQGSVEFWAETSTAGTYDETTYPVIVGAVGGIFQDWTITFSSSTAFDCVGNTVGSIGSGNTSSSFFPSNPAFAAPYFTLSPLGFGGTWAIGESITFRTNPFCYPVWFKKVVPSGASSYSGNNFNFRIVGESV